MRRVLKSFGFLNRKVRKGQAINDKRLAQIYKKLIEIGFKETPWQYVYEGQLGGIVLPYGNGINEIHLRFYDDRCFSELEIGRALVSHFFGPQYNAKYLLEEIVEPHLSKDEWRYLKSLLNRNIKEDEAKLQVWNKDFGLDPYAVIVRGAPNVCSTVTSVFAGLGWKSIAVYIIPCASIICMLLSPEIAWGLFGLTSVASSAVLPSVGNP